MQHVNSSNMGVYLNLAQAYEAEFSPLTGKLPHPNGLYELDTIIAGSVIGYIEYYEQRPIGIAAVKKTHSCLEMKEFYIVPNKRMGGIGKVFAHKILSQHLGPWEILQISGADHATQFWRKALSSFGVTYVEDVHFDPYWKWVTRQSFEMK